MDSSKKAILETLIYSDIFDYPLSEGEIWKFLHADKKIKKKSFIKKVKEINSVVEHEKDMLFLKGKRKSVIRRIEREKESLQKIEYAKKIIKKIFLVPTVLFVGISGSLSVLNASKNDDIDLFIIARKNTVWASRFFVILLLKFLGVHRRRGGKDIKNKFCLNMIIDESSLKFSKAKQDLYTAHEIAQVLPIIERGQTYSRFINSNLRIKKTESLKGEPKYLFLYLFWRISLNGLNPFS